MKPTLKDIYAGFILIWCMAMISIGINSLVSGITIMIVTYYFRKRSEDYGLC
jgi:hypothetical protein